MVYHSWKIKAEIKVEGADPTLTTLAKIYIPWLPVMANDFRDIRFSTLGKKLKYWIQGKEDHTQAQAGTATVWVQVPPKVQNIFLHYGNGTAVSESSLSGLGALFYDDLESGSVASAKWDTKNSLFGGTTAIRSDYVYGAYSIGTNQNSTQGDGIYNYDQCHALIKIPLTSFPVGTTVNIHTSLRHWKNTTNAATFAGLGMGGNRECVNIAAGDAWRPIVSRITRTATSTWSVHAYEGTTDLGTISKTNTFSTNFNYGIQTRLNSGTGYSCFLRCDNVLAWAGAAPTLTLLAHEQAHLTQAGALNIESAASRIGTRAGYSFKDQPIVIQSVIGVSPISGNQFFNTVDDEPFLTVDGLFFTVGGEDPIKNIVGGVSNIGMATAAETHDTTISIETAVGIRPGAQPLKYYIDVGVAQAGILLKTSDGNDFYTQDSLEFHVKSHELGAGITTAATASRFDFIHIDSKLGVSSFIGTSKFETLSDYAVVAADVSKTVTDAVWQLQTEFIGEAAPGAFYPIHHQAPDHNGVMRHLFTGICPVTDQEISSVGKKTKVTAYDYGWYLSAQYVPNDARTIEISRTWWTWGKTTWQAWINYLLEDTGITAYKIRPGPSVLWKQFIFSNKTTKKEAIEQISDYCGYIFEIKWRDYGTAENPDWRPIAYWVPEADIDDASNGLDLPSPVTLTWPDPNLVDLPTIQTAPEERVNRVRIIGSDSDGHFFSQTYQTAAVTSKTELPREYLEESSALTSQSQVNAYASAMLTYFTRPAVVVSMKFINRFDLQLYQKIKFGAGFPSDLYALTDGRDGINYLRIVGIKYHTAPADNYVEVTAVYDHPIIITRKRQRILKPNFISEVENTVIKHVESQTRACVGTIESISSDKTEAVLISEFGNRIRVRIN